MEPKKCFWSPVNVMVAIYFVVWGFAAMDRLLIAMLFPFVLPYFHLNYAQGGILMMCMALGFEVVGFLGGPASDKWGRKKIITPCVWIFSIGSAITGFAGSFAQLVGVRTLVGAGEGAFGSAAAAQIAEEAPPAKRGLYLGFYTSAFALFGSFIAPLYATQMAPRIGWQWTCYLTIIPGVILALLIRSKVKETKRFTSPQAAGPKVSWLKVIQERNIVVALLVSIFWFIWLWSWLTFGTVFLVDFKHIPIGSAGILQSAFGAGGFIGMIVLPALSDKFGRKLPLIVGTVIGIIGTLMLIYVPASWFISLCITFFITAFVAWGYAPIFINVIPSESVPAQWIASGVALVSCIGELVGIGAGQPVLGMVGDKFGLDHSMLLGCACLVVVFILCLVLRESAPKFAKPKVQELETNTVAS